MMIFYTSHEKRASDGLNGASCWVQRRINILWWPRDTQTVMFIQQISQKYDPIIMQRRSDISVVMNAANPSLHRQWLDEQMLPK
jgi:hypothetical protein